MEIERFAAPRQDSPHIEIRYDVERDTAITAEWNAAGTHMIISFGGFRSGLRLLMRPHAAKRLSDALQRADAGKDEYIRA